MKAGWRFEVSLEGAVPWTLAYPDEIPMLVTAGSSAEPKTFGEMLGPDGQLKDPLWLHENLPPELAPRPIAGVDDFESVHYDLSYRWEKGGLSKWLVVNYRDGTSKDINIDAINESTPKLMAAKKDALKIMDDYNALFILQTFPTVFYILTVAPTVTASGAKGPFSVRRTQVPKSRIRGGGKAPEPGTKTDPGAKTEPKSGSGKIETEEAPPKSPVVAESGEMFGARMAQEMKDAGYKGNPYREFMRRMNSLPQRLPPREAADAIRVATNRFTKGTQGTMPPVQMGDILVVPSRAEIPNAPVMGIKSDGTVIMGRVPKLEIVRTPEGVPVYPPSVKIHGQITWE